VDAGLQPRPVSEATLELLGRYDRLFTATSINDERWELRFTARARELGVPSLAVLDFWGQYRGRFTWQNHLEMPDRIAVMDDVARGEMLREGFPAIRLAVTGQPALDELSEYAKPEVRSSCHRELRRRARIEDLPGPVILYASQPLSQLHDPAVLGFHERDVLIDTVAAAGAVLARHRQHATLVIKPHPREVGHPIALPQSGPSLTVRLLNESDVSPRLAAAGADLVVGMNSMLLLEACLLGTPVVSYQPGLKQPDVLPSNRLGWSRGVFNRADLEGALEEELLNNRTATFSSLRGADQAGATGRVIALLLAEPPAAMNLRRIA
ncbi:MAG TPA: hypothetical protein VMJ30_05460, partial [Gemmatimonadales bacterium]|nr:hypothetical protein [Gemmatimonadales bacterium]